MPSRVSSIGIRPAWIARKTAARVSIHMRSAARTVCDAVSALARKRAKGSFGGRRRPGSGCVPSAAAAASGVTASTGAISIRHPAAAI